MSPLDLERIDGVPIAHVNEDIDAANATTTQQQLADALGPDASSLVIDLSETRYLDSAGIDMLLRLSDRLDHRRAKLILVIPDASQLKRLASIVGLPDAIAIHPTLPAALQEADEPVNADRDAPGKIMLLAFRLKGAGASSGEDDITALGATTHAYNISTTRASQNRG